MIFEMFSMAGKTALVTGASRGINNAGGPIFNAPFLETRPQGWDRLIELNLTSVEEQTGVIRL